MASSYVVAFDPGTLTGFARALVQDGVIQWINTGELPFPELVKQWHVLFSGENLTVVVEDWRIYPDKTEAFMLQRQPAPEMIGAIRALAYEHDQVDITRQMAVQAKKQWPNARLHRHGYTATGHARDALRHLLTYCENKLSVDLVDRSEPI